MKIQKTIRWGAHRFSRFRPEAILKTPLAENKMGGGAAFSFPIALRRTRSTCTHTAATRAVIRRLRLDDGDGADLDVVVNDGRDVGGEADAAVRSGVAGKNADVEADAAAGEAAEVGHGGATIAS